MPPLPKATSPAACVLRYYGDAPGRVQCYLERTDGDVIRSAFFGDRTEADALAWAASLHSCGVPVIRDDTPAPEAGPTASRTRREATQTN